MNGSIPQTVAHGLKKAALELAEPFVIGALIFLAASTFDYWQAWVFLAVFILPGRVVGMYLARKHPAVLERRTRGGPTAETRVTQKAVMASAWASLAAMLVVSSLDHRFGWSNVPTTVCVLGDVLVLLGVSLMMLVMIQNSYASAVIRVEDGQQLISSGVYGLVRHPMYTGNLLMIIGTPLALGSYWGLVFVISGLSVLCLRIRDEEKLLRDELAGYDVYAQKVGKRLVPGIW